MEAIIILVAPLVFMVMLLLLPAYFRPELEYIFSRLRLFRYWRSSGDVPQYLRDSFNRQREESYERLLLSIKNRKALLTQLRLLSWDHNLTSDDREHLARIFGDYLRRLELEYRKELLYFSKLVVIEEEQG